MPAHFIFANLNGTISAWNAGTAATLEATTPGAVYTGLAIASNTAGNFLYAANDAQGTSTSSTASSPRTASAPTRSSTPSSRPGSSRST